jgi:hypothetical protein
MPQSPSAKIKSGKVKNVMDYYFRFYVSTQKYLSVIFARPFNLLLNASNK